MLLYSPLVPFPKDLEKKSIRILDENLHQENRVLRHQCRKHLLFDPALELSCYDLSRIRMTNTLDERFKKCGGNISLLKG